MKYDVVIGNPPYQKSSNSGSSIWQHFVADGYSRLASGGFMSMVHPAGWRSANGKSVKSAKDILVSPEMIRLSINGLDDGKKTFDVGVRYDWYVFQKGRSGKTLTRQEGASNFVEIDLQQWKCMPNFAHGMWGTIFNRQEPKMEWHRDSFNTSHSPHVDNAADAKKTKSNPHPVCKALSSKQVRWMWSEKQAQHDDQLKVLTTAGNYPYPVLDTKGVGTGEEVLFCEVKSKAEGEAICNFFRSKTGWAISRSTKWGNYRTEHKMLSLLPNPHEMGLTGKSTDKDIYKAFGFDKETIAEIESISKTRPEAVARGIQAEFDSAVKGL